MNDIARQDAASGGELFGDEARLDPEGLLGNALGRTPEADELALWASMPSDRREKALVRIAVLRRWTEEPGEMTAAEAAGQAEVAVSRFYEIAAAWKSSPTLASVGTFAKRPGRRGPRLSGRAVNGIQAVLPTLVRANSDAKIATIVNLIKAEPSLQGLDLPHINTLRSMVERERRRLRAEQQVGLRPGLDAVACDLLRPDGTYHVIFGVIDRTSRLVLGFSLGDVDESLAAYRRAAQDALDRMREGNVAALPWSDSTTRVDVIVGDDQQAWRDLQRQYLRQPIGPEFALVDSPRRYGRYFKIASGNAIGDLKIWPARIGSVRHEGPAHAYTNAEAAAAIENEIARHNAEVMEESTAKGAARPAPVTVRMLEFIAGVEQA